MATSEIFVFCFFLLAFASGQELQTFTIRYKKGDMLIPATVEFDQEHKLEYVKDLNFLPNRTLTLYDFDRNIIAYKDIDSGQCFLSKMKQETFEGEIEAVKSLEDGIVENSISPVLYASNSVLQDGFVLKMAGIRIANFCRDMATSLVTKKHRKHILAKRNANQYSHQSYSRHSQQSSSYSHESTSTGNAGSQSMFHGQLRAQEPMHQSQKSSASYSSMSSYSSSSHAGGAHGAVHHNSESTFPSIQFPSHNSFSHEPLLQAEHFRHSKTGMQHSQDSLNSWMMQVPKYPEGMSTSLDKGMSLMKSELEHGKVLLGPDTDKHHLNHFVDTSVDRNNKQPVYRESSVVYSPSSYYWRTYESSGNIHPMPKTSSDHKDFIKVFQGLDGETPSSESRPRTPLSNTGFSTQEIPQHNIPGQSHSFSYSASGKGFSFSSSSPGQSPQYPDTSNQPSSHYPNQPDHPFKVSPEQEYPEGASVGIRAVSVTQVKDGVSIPRGPVPVVPHHVVQPSVNMYERRITESNQDVNYGARLPSMKDDIPDNQMSASHSVHHTRQEQSQKRNINSDDKIIARPATPDSPLTLQQFAQQGMYSRPNHNPTVPHVASPAVLTQGSHSHLSQTDAAYALKTTLQNPQPSIPKQDNARYGSHLIRNPDDVLEIPTESGRPRKPQQSPQFTSEPFPEYPQAAAPRHSAGYNSELRPVSRGDMGTHDLLPEIPAPVHPDTSAIQTSSVVLTASETREQGETRSILGSRPHQTEDQKLGMDRVSQQNRFSRGQVEDRIHSRTPGPEQVRPRNVHFQKPLQTSVTEDDCEETQALKRGALVAARTLTEQDSHPDPQTRPIQRPAQDSYSQTTQDHFAMHLGDVSVQSSTGRETEDLRPFRTPQGVSGAEDLVVKSARVPHSESDSRREMSQYMQARTDLTSASRHVQKPEQVPIIPQRHTGTSAVPCCSWTKVALQGDIPSCCTGASTDNALSQTSPLAMGMQTGSNGSGQPCRIIKTTCYSVYQTAGIAQVCRPTVVDTC